MRSIAITLICLVAAISLTGCERRKLDQQMEELCKKDAGVKVYEKVTLSPEEYKAVFNYVVKAKIEEEYYGPAYRYLSTRTHLVGKQDDALHGRGELVRHYSAIYRRSDSRLLGEDVSYARSGGDFFTFGLQPSGKSCPSPGLAFAQSIFVKGE